MEEIINGVSHEVVIYKNTTFKKDIRKNVGGDIARKFAKGITLNAYFSESSKTIIDGLEVNIAPKAIKVDELPDKSKYYIVSLQYVTACKELGKDTSHLLTTSGAVVDSNDTSKVIGCTGLIRN